MKKLLSLILAIGLLCLPVFAEAEDFSDMIKVLQSTPGLEITQPEKEELPTDEDLDSAVEEAMEQEEGCPLRPGRLTVFQVRNIRCEREVYDVSFKVWSTLGRNTGLFFRAEDSESWTLISVNTGDIDVIEGRFTAPGTYAIAVGW